jgi:Leucine rich repeat
MSKRAFDGLAHLKRLSLENNQLKALERGVFSPMPALAFLNLMRNSLETITLHTVQPLINNLLNHASMLLIKGNFVIFKSNLSRFPIKFDGYCKLFDVSVLLNSSNMNSLFPGPAYIHDETNFLLGLKFPVFLLFIPM